MPCYVDTHGGPTNFLNRNRGRLDWGDGREEAGEGMEGEETGETDLNIK